MVTESCKNLCELLKDTETRRTMLRINELAERCSEDPRRVEAALHCAMRNDSFCETVNSCLRIVDPQTYEKIYDENLKDQGDDEPWT